MEHREDLIKAMTEAVTEAFSTTMSIELAQAAELPEAVPQAELICSIGLAGTLEGSVSVSLTAKSAAAIVGAMLGCDVAPGSPDVSDGMGEVVNMIAGGIKMRAAALGFNFNVSIPTVVEGKLMHLTVSEDLQKGIRHFSCDRFAFDVELIYKVNDPAKAAPAAAPSSKMSAFEKLKAMTAKAPTA